MHDPGTIVPGSCYVRPMERITHQGKIIEVVEEEVEQGGSTRTFEYARRSPGTRLIIPKRDQLLITKEFRHERGTYDYRLPGGKVFDTLKEYNVARESGIDLTEAAKNAAIKEAHEEAGIEVTALSFFHRSVCGATVVWDLYYFVVDEFSETDQHLEDGEDISLEFTDRETVRRMCLDGSVGEERSALILLRYLNA